MFSNIDKKFHQWRMFPEIAHFLGRFATRRRYDLRSLTPLIVASELGEGLGKEELSSLLCPGIALELEEGPAILGITAPCDIEASATRTYPAGHILGCVGGTITANGHLKILDGAMTLARQWDRILTCLPMTPSLKLPQ